MIFTSLRGGCWLNAFYQAVLCVHGFTVPKVICLLDAQIASCTNLDGLRSTEKNGQKVDGLKRIMSVKKSIAIRPHLKFKLIANSYVTTNKRLQKDLTEFSKCIALFCPLFLWLFKYTRGNGCSSQLSNVSQYRLKTTSFCFYIF